MTTTSPALTAPMPVATPSALAAPPTGPRFKLRNLRERCLDCTGGEQGRVRTCDVRECPLWDYRMGHRPKGYKARWTPLRALRAYCLWCCLDQAKEVRLCPATSCPLWPWRMGKGTGEVPATTPADARSPAEPEIPTPQAGSRDGDAGAASDTSGAGASRKRAPGGQVRR